jgi:hypothetical protein
MSGASDQFMAHTSEPLEGAPPIQFVASDESGDDAKKRHLWIAGSTSERMQSEDKIEPKFAEGTPLQQAYIYD